MQIMLLLHSNVMTDALGSNADNVKLDNTCGHLC